MLGLVRRDVAINVFFVIVDDCLREGRARRVGRSGDRYCSTSRVFPFLWGVVFYRACLLAPSATVVRIVIGVILSAALGDGGNVLMGRGGSEIDGVG